MGACLPKPEYHHPPPEASEPEWVQIGMDHPCSYNKAADFLFKAYRQLQFRMPVRDLSREDRILLGREALASFRRDLVFWHGRSDLDVNAYDDNRVKAARTAYSSALGVQIPDEAPVEETITV